MATNRIDLPVASIARRFESGEGVTAIARSLGCSRATIYTRLGEAGVQPVGGPPFDVEEATALYVDGARLSQLATRYGLVAQTVRKYLVANGVTIRSVREAQQPIGRRSCPTSAVLRAYLLGFATGDLYVRRPNPSGTTIEAGCSTTHREQVALMREVFGPFGPVRTSGLTVRASLDSTFAFLLDKYVRTVPRLVIEGADEVQASYAAGYIDAEGSFGVYGGRGRFKVDSYDSHVLAWMASWCRRIGVDCRASIVGHAGDSRPDGTTFPRDLHRVTVNRTGDLLRLVATIDPFLQHARRRSAAERVRQNVMERLSARVRPVPPSEHQRDSPRGPRQDDAL